MDKLGVFLCKGCQIGESLDLDEFESLVEEHGASTYVCHDCLCSPEGVATIRSAIEDGSVNGALIAACSHRVKKEEFRFDATQVAVERASLREQAVWSHEANDEDTQMIAADLLRMGLARLSKVKLPARLDEEIDRTVLVVGGGLAGLTAAKAAAGMGHPVVLVESQDRLGGYLLGVSHLVPEQPPYDQVHANEIATLVAAVMADAAIQVKTGTSIKKIAGQPGQFEVQLEGGGGAETLKAGAIIQATGARPYNANKLKELGYGASPDVVTSHELEGMLKEKTVQRPSDGDVPKRVVFIQCAGSRDPAHLRYCSSECCATSMKQVAAIHRINPDIECAVIYRDLRAPGQLEHFYKAVQSQPGSLFARGEVSRVTTDGGIKVMLETSLLGDDIALDADLVVLATGMVPHSADGEAIRTFLDARARSEKSDSDKQRAEAAKIVEQLKHHENTEILHLGYRQGPDLPTLAYDFPDSHYICFPYETRRTGVYAAGTVRAPMDAAQAAEDGYGAAMKAVQVIRANERGEAVHPRAGDITVADFFLQRCTQCKRCTEECPFGTLDEDVKGTPQYNQLRCRRCGICLGACPERIISFPDYSIDAVSTMIKAVEVPDEIDEKPRILAFMCENDAIPALDEAARRGLKWNAWVRIIPVRCLGAVNTVWVADSLSSGFDGVLLIGCKHGDDYQCHYIKGSELAAKRMGNVQETLDRLALEAERLSVIEIARNEYHRIPEIFDEFAATVEDVGPNPYKGF